MATGAGKKDARASKERSRLYQARRQFHSDFVKRRSRDNLIAGVGGGVLILAIIVGQTAYFSAGPGAPAPTPSPTASPAPTPSPTPTATPAPTGSPAPTGLATPSPAPTP